LIDLFCRPCTKPFLDEDYSSFVRSQNIGAFIQSQVDGKVKYLSGFHSAIGPIKIPDFPPPVVQFRLSEPDKNDGAAKALNVEVVPGLKGVYQGKPTWEDFVKMMKLGISETRFAPGTVSMNAYISFFYAIRLAVAYSVVSRPMEKVAGTYIYGANAVGDFTGDPAKAQYHTVSRSGTVQTMDTLEQGGFNAFISGNLYPLATPLSKSNTVEQGTFTEWTRNAKNVETISFKYFRDMYTPDAKFVVNLIQRLFFRSLGNSEDACTKAMQFIKAGMRSLVHTPEGEALSHMYLGIQLAENGGFGYYPIFKSGVYGGFILAGRGNVLYQGKVLKKGTTAVAKSFIDSMDLHDQRIAEIAAIFEGVCLADGSKKYPCSPSQIDTSRKLQDFYQIVDLGDFALTVDTIISKIDDLRFSDRYANPSIENIRIAIEYMISGDKNLLVPFHRYIRAGAIKRRSNVAVALSIFGPRVPSINYGLSSKTKQNFQIPKDEAKQDLNLVAQADGKPAIQYIPVSLVNFDQAVNQWEKLFRSGVLTIPAPRSGKKEFTDMTIVNSQIGGRDLEPMYKLVKKAVIFYATQVDKSTGKRKGVDRDNEGPVRKARKDFDENAAASGLLE